MNTFMSLPRGNEHFSSDTSQLEIEISFNLPASEPEINLKFINHKHNLHYTHVYLLLVL